MYSHPNLPLISIFNSNYNSSSISELLGSLCDCSLNGVSWKRHALGGTSKEGALRTLKKHAYGALLLKLFQNAPPQGFASGLSAISATPSKNKVLMLSFDLRVAGCQDEAEKLETQLGKLSPGTTFWLKELDSVLEFLVQLAGSTPQPPTSFNWDYMRQERPVLRRALLGGYQSDELQRLEAKAWSLVCAEEWAKLGCQRWELRLMDAPPGTGLLALGKRSEVEERFDKETRLSLFGALHHTRTSDLDIRLDLPCVPSNADDIGLAIRVPPSLDQYEDEGFQSASNLTPDSQSNHSPTPEIDIWEALQTFVPERRRYWERVGCSPGKREVPFLTEGGRQAFDQLYQLSEEQLRVMSSATPSPFLSLPLDSQTQLVSDVLNMLIGVASITLPLNQVCLQFDVRPGVCVSGTSPETVCRLLGELAQYGTHYLRLSCFSLQSENKKGLVFQAFTGGLRKYLHYYRACVLSTLPTLSLLTIGFLFRKMGRQLRYLSELCCVDGACGKGKATFPMGVKLLSYLYNEAQSNCSNENYPVLLSLLKSSCEPYTRFVSDWVYSGVFRDVYGEFMIQINDDYLCFRDKTFWVQGYTLISEDVEDCVPVFLRHIANDIYVCGKSINLLKICCPQHYICWSELSLPRIAVTFSLQEVEEIERDCAVYRGRMERIAKHSVTSREDKALRTEQACQELINQVRQSAAKTLESIRGQQVSQCLAEEAKKRERFKEMRQYLEQEQEWHSGAKRKAEEDDYSFARELRDREKRLQAIEEQLDHRARKDLIAQYSHLSEEAARKERRAIWRVQRMRFGQARVQFLQQDWQWIEQVDQYRQEVNEYMVHEGTFEAPPVDYDFNAPFSPLEVIASPVQPKSDAPPDTPKLFSIEVNTSEVQLAVGIPCLNEFMATPLPSPLLGSTYGHSSDSTLAVGCVVSGPELLPMHLPSSDYGHSSDSTLGLGCVVSRPELLPMHLPCGAYGHSSDSTLGVGCVVSGPELLPMHLPGGAYGRSSDSTLGVGCVVSGPELLPMHLPGSAYGHSSDSTLGEGCVVSGPELLPMHLPRGAYGHSSDSTLGVGCVVSGPELLPMHLPGSAYGHSSDSTLGEGCVVSGPELLPMHLPRGAYGHSSDSTLGVGCVVSGPELLPMHLPGSAYGHSSDSTLGEGCVVSGPELLPMHLPGSAYGHSSDSTLGEGCVVSGEEFIPVQLSASAYGHSSDSTLGVGCAASGEELLPMHLPASAYGHFSNSTHGVSWSPSEQLLDKGISAWAGCYGGESSERDYLLYLAAQYQVEHYEDCYNLMSLSPESQMLQQVTRGPWDLPTDLSMRRASDTTSVQLSAMVSLPVLMKHSVTTPLITHVSLVNKAVVDYIFVELGVDRHFEALRHFLLMEDGEFAQSLSDLLFEKLGSGQTPGELLTPLVLNSILSKALQYSLHGDSALAANFTFALRFFPETFHPHAPDSLNCLELRYKVNWPLNIIITDSCMNKYNRLFSFLLQLKHMVWSLRDVWFHLKRTALVKGAAQSVQFRQLQLYRHEMQHFVKVIQGYIANQILQVSWSEFTAKLATASHLDAIHSMHTDYLNRAIFRGLLTEKAAPVMNIIHSIFSLILKFRSQLIAQPWDCQQGEAVHPSFVAMQQSYNTFKYYSHFLFKVVTKLVNRGYQPHLEDFLLRINFNNYYEDF
ncbi:gamma-tubulin complex component 6 [Aplochiton taeniatus]